VTSNKEACLNLPLFSIPPKYVGKSHTQRQRSNDRILTLTAANGCVTSLNFLSSSNKSFLMRNVFESSQQSSSSKTRSSTYLHQSRPALNEAQRQRILQFILAASKRFVARARDGSVDIRQPSFGYHQTSAAVPLVAHKVAIPDIAGVVKLTDVLPRVIASRFESPSPELFRADAATLSVPPLLMASQSEYLKFILRLKQAGMVSFTLRPRCVNGVFFVDKGDGTLRFIVNAIPANSMFVEPPHTDLPTPDLLSYLILQEAAELFVAKMDISNYYHQLLLPEWMCDYFALPPVSAAALGLEQYGDVDVFPCSRTLPMGFSWSVFLAQAAHEHLVSSRLGWSKSDFITRNTDSCLDRPRFSMYIDDCGIFSTDRALCQQLQSDYIRMCADVGLPLKMSKVHPPCSTGVDVIGVRVHGKSHTVGVDSAKLAVLVDATLDVLARGEATGDEMQSIVGHWTWAVLVRRPVLSVLCSVYKFIATAKSRSFTIWDSVRNELVCLCGLAPLLFTTLSARLFPRLIAFDASTTGQGVVMSRVPESVVARVADGLNPQPSHEPLERYSERILRSQEWSTLVSAQWRSVEHINVKEMRAGLTAARWVSTSPSAFGSRVLLLSDSAVACAIISKGRSSSYSLLRVMRLLSSVILAFNLQVLVRWVPSCNNPADGPSRAFDNFMHFFPLF